MRRAQIRGEDLREQRNFGDEMPLSVVMCFDYFSSIGAQLLQRNARLRQDTLRELLPLLRDGHEVDKTNVRTYFPTVAELIVFFPTTRLISCVIASSVCFALWKKATTDCRSVIWR
jgi:hypothetical protein